MKAIINDPKKDLSIPKFHRRVMVFDTETTGLMPKHKSGTPFPPIESYPHIMQFSWIVYNITKNCIEEIVNEYVKIPKTVDISAESMKVHGITREIAEEKGKPITYLLSKFFVAYMKCDCIIAHNLRFDAEMVRKEMWRNRDELQRKTADSNLVNKMCGIFTKKYNDIYNIDTFCTMMNTIQFCNIDLSNNLVQPPLPQTLKEDPLPTHTVTTPETIFISEPKINIVAVSPKPPIRKKFPRLNELYSKLFESELPADLHNSIIDVLVCLRCFLKVRGVVEMSELEFQTLIGTYSRT